MTDRYERIRAALAMEPTPVSWAQDIDDDVAYAMFRVTSAAEQGPAAAGLGGVGV